MKAKCLVPWVLVCLVSLIFFAGASAPAAEKPIVIGAPLATGFLYGWDAERGIRLAVEEINAKGGVKVGGVKRPFEVSVMDTRDLEPGVPVSDALLTVEKLILEKKADFLIGGSGPVGSGPGCHGPAVQIQENLHPDHRGPDPGLFMPGWLKIMTSSNTASGSAGRPNGWWAGR